jgi:hypothetical protein
MLQRTTLPRSPGIWSWAAQTLNSLTLRRSGGACANVVCCVSPCAPSRDVTAVRWDRSDMSGLFRTTLRYYYNLKYLPPCSCILNNNYASNLSSALILWNKRVLLLLNNVFTISELIPPLFKTCVNFVWERKKELVSPLPFILGGEGESSRVFFVNCLFNGAVLITSSQRQATIKQNVWKFI